MPVSPCSIARHAPVPSTVQVPCGRVNALLDGKQTYTVSTLLGKRDEPALTVCARHLAQSMADAGCTRLAACFPRHDRVSSFCWARLREAAVQAAGAVHGPEGAQPGGRAGCDQAGHGSPCVVTGACICPACMHTATYFVSNVLSYQFCNNHEAHQPGQDQQNRSTRWEWHRAP